VKVKESFSIATNGKFDKKNRWPNVHTSSMLFEKKKKKKKKNQKLINNTCFLKKKKKKNEYSDVNDTPLFRSNLDTVMKGR